MQKITKEILDEIISKFSKNEISIYLKKDDNGNEVYVISKGKELNLLKRRLADKIPKDKEKTNKLDTICIIKVYKKEKEASIHFRNFLSIDPDMHSIYEYMKEFLAFVKSKVRQTNAWGIQVQLGLISVDEFNKLDDSFVENRELVINEIFDERNKELTL